MFKWLAQRPVPEWASFFERAEFDDFVRAVAEDLQRRGDIVEIDDGIARVDLGETKQQFGLQNLAQVCNQTAPEQWPSLIREHFDSVIRSAATTDLDELADDFERARPRLKIRLYPVAALQGEEAETVCRPLGEELVAALVYDLPGAVATVPRHALEKWPVDEAEAFAIALRNVIEQDPVEPKSLDIEGVGELFTVIDDSFFVTSHLLALDRYIDSEQAIGAIVAVPNRHTLLFAPLVDAGVIGMLNALVLITHRRHETGPGSLSPHLYWWNDGKLTALPARVVDEEVELFPPKAFVEFCLGRLAKPGRRSVGPN